MSEKQPDTLTHHAMLVAWGQFAQSIGMIRDIEGVALHQKTVEHSPQTKILEFFIAILAGLPHLQDQPLRSPHRPGPGRRQSLAASRLGRLQRCEPHPIGD